MRSMFFTLLLLLSPAVFAEGSLVLEDGGLASAASLSDAGVPSPLSVSLPPGTPVLNLDQDPLSALSVIHDAVQNKAWGKLLFVLVTIIVWILRRFLSKPVPALASDGAAVIMTFCVVFSAMFVTTWGAGSQPSLMDVVNAVMMAAAASGIWTWGKKVIVPFVQKLFSKPSDPAATPPGGA